MFKRPKPKSLKKSLFNAVYMPVLFIGSMWAGITFSEHFAPTPPAPPAPPASESAQQIDPETLAKGFECWGNDGIDHGIPSNVIFHYGDHNWRMGGKRIVTKALEQLPVSIGGPGLDHGIQTYKFCHKR